MTEPRFVKLDMEFWISENDWEALEGHICNLPEFVELQKMQLEKGSAEGAFSDPLDFFSKCFALVYHGDDCEFYCQQEQRRKHAKKEG
jgi:hypothetical protein